MLVRYLKKPSQAVLGPRPKRIVPTSFLMELCPSIKYRRQGRRGERKDGMICAQSVFDHPPGSHKACASGSLDVLRTSREPARHTMQSAFGEAMTEVRCARRSSHRPISAEMGTELRRVGGRKSGFGPVALGALWRLPTGGAPHRLVGAAGVHPLCAFGLCGRPAASSSPG